MCKVKNDRSIIVPGDTSSFSDSAIPASYTSCGNHASRSDSHGNHNRPGKPQHPLCAKYTICKVQIDRSIIVPGDTSSFSDSAIPASYTSCGNHASRSDSHGNHNRPGKPQHPLCAKYTMCKVQIDRSTCLVIHLLSHSITIFASSKRKMLFPFPIIMDETTTQVYCICHHKSESPMIPIEYYFILILVCRHILSP